MAFSPELFAFFGTAIKIIRGFEMHLLTKMLSRLQMIVQQSVGTLAITVNVLALDYVNIPVKLFITSRGVSRTL